MNSRSCFHQSKRGSYSVACESLRPLTQASFAVGGAVTKVAKVKTGTFTVGLLRVGSRRNGAAERVAVRQITRSWPSVDPCQDGEGLSPVDNRLLPVHLQGFFCGMAARS